MRLSFLATRGPTSLTSPPFSYHQPVKSSPFFPVSLRRPALELQQRKQRSLCRSAASSSSQSDSGEEGSTNGADAVDPSSGRAPKRIRALPLSLFKPFGNKLPKDGRLQTEEEELCDPYERNCQTPIYVWENKCEACSGLGQVRSRSSRSGRGRGNRTLFSATYYTCMACHGLGYVRRASARMLPELNGGSGPDYTLGRPPSDDEIEDGSDSYGLNSSNGTGENRQNGSGPYV